MTAAEAVPGRPSRVLVVEDSFLTARRLAEHLAAWGVSVVGPVSNVRDAMSILDDRGCDGAILDINLGDETVEPVAWRLESEGTPYFFLSGYMSPKSLNEQFKHRPLVHKPFEPSMLRRAIASWLGF